MLGWYQNYWVSCERKASVQNLVSCFTFKVCLIHNLWCRETLNSCRNPWSIRNKVKKPFSCFSIQFFFSFHYIKEKNYISKYFWGADQKPWKHKKRKMRIKTQTSFTQKKKQIVGWSMRKSWSGWPFWRTDFKYS